MELSLIVSLAVATLTAVAAVTDLGGHRIPNWLTVPAALLGLAFHGLAPGGEGILAALGGLGIGLVLLMLPALLGGGGMGDVKLLAALGAWLGVERLLLTFVLAVMLAAFLAVVVLGYSALSQGLAKTRGRFIGTPSAALAAPAVGQRVLPFAVPVALATWSLVAWWLLETGL